MVSAKRVRTDLETEMLLNMTRPNTLLIAQNHKQDFNIRS
jgi:hypothetical protein